MKGTTIFAILIPLAISLAWPAPHVLAEECGLNFTECDFRQGELWGLMADYGIFSQDEPWYCARKIVLQGDTDIRQVKLRLVSYSAPYPNQYVFVGICDGDKQPESVYRGIYTAGADWITSTEGWCAVPGWTPGVIPAGTYWLVLGVPEESGPLQIRWLGKGSNVCGTTDDNVQGTWGGMRAWPFEAAYELVCNDCPTLSNPTLKWDNPDGELPSSPPQSPPDNRQRNYVFEVIYKNPGNVAPTEHKVGFGGPSCVKEWHDMQRVDEVPFNQGTRYRYTYSGRLGVGDAACHGIEFSFKTEAGRSIVLNMNGPNLPPVPPTIASATFSPAALKVNGQVTFSSDAHDADSNDNIKKWYWRLVDQDNPQRVVTFEKDYSGFSTSANAIGIGNWKVYLKVQDDEVPQGLYSEEKMAAAAGNESTMVLQIVDTAAPTITNIKASLDGWGADNDDTVGVFLAGAGVTVDNKFSVTVTDEEGDLSYVKFMLGTSTWHDYDLPYELTLDMNTLSVGENLLKVQAFDQAGHASIAKEVKIIAVGPPEWWDKWWVYDKGAYWDNNERRYTLRCRIPQFKNPLYPPTPPEYIQLNYSHDIPTGSYFGTLHNNVGSYIEVFEHFRIGGHDGKGYWSYSATGQFDVTFLDYTLEHVDLPVTWQLKGVSMEYERNLDYYRVRLFCKELFDKSIEGPSYDYRGVIMAGPVPVEYHAGLDTEIGFNLKFSVDGDLNSDLGFQRLVFTPSPKFSVEFDMFIEIYEGLAKLGLKATPTFCLDLPLMFYPIPDPPEHPYPYMDFVPCLHFWVHYTVYGSIAWGLLEGDLYEDSYPKPPYKYPDPNCVAINCGEESECDGEEFRARPAQTEVKELFAAPSIASDKEGISSICVWVHDADNDPAILNPELYYSYYPDAQNGWSAPAPVFAINNQRFETDPKVIYTDQNTVMLVWTQNELDRATSQSRNFIPDVVKEQELYYTTWTYDPNTKTGQWSPLGAQKLTDDTVATMNPQFPAHHGDGLVALGADQVSGKAIAVWVRETWVFQGVKRDETNYNPTWEIYYAMWNGNAWSPPTPLTNDNTADAQPDVAMDSNGNAKVVWVRDTDGDFTTNNDRFVTHQTYTSQTQSWGNMIVEQTWPSGALSPAVTYDHANNPIILFNKRDNNSEGQAIQEGPSERLWSACFGGGQPVVAPVGQADGPRCLEPKIRCDVQNQTIAIWRGFPAEGTDGFDGEVAMNLRYAGLPTCTNWGGTCFLTNDDITDWQVDFDVDQADTIRIVYVKKQPGVPGASFGQGFDSIYLLEIARGPDLVIDPGSIGFSNPRPTAGENVVISAPIRNAGNQRAFGFTIDFLVDGASIGTQVVPMLIGQGTFDATQTWQSDGLPHTVTVIADSTNQVAETNESNNSDSRRIGELYPATGLIAYPDPAARGAKLTWRHPGGADHFNIYRSQSSGGGYEEIGESPTDEYLDATVEIDTQYYYVVTAEDETGESPYSNEAPFNIGVDSDGDRFADSIDPDDDNDGMSDICEIANDLNPLDPGDADDDPDQDGFTNLQECQEGTAPHDVDSHPDIIPPTTPVVTANRYTTSTSELSATWTCTEEYSGIAEYRYAIGTFAGGMDVRGWTSNGTSNALMATGLSLIGGQSYYIAVRAIDGAGNESAVGVSSAITVDTTPPTILAGPDAGAWTPENSISASWYAEDEESGLESFEYSVGTAPGQSDIADWTDVDLALEFDRSGLALANGEICYVNLRATNGAGLQATANSGPVRAVKTPGTIAGALDLSDGTWLALSGKLVTGIVQPYAWIEEPDLSAALRMETGLAVSEGDMITVSGQIVTPVYTRQLVPESLDLESSGNAVTPVGVTNVTIGGAARNAYTRGVDGGFGVNNVALLVTTWGKVTAAGSGYFYIDDGSRLEDRTGNLGVRIASAGLTNPAAGQYVIVTGLVNATRLTFPDGSTRSIRLLIPRRQSDIRVIGGEGIGQGATRDVSSTRDVDEVK